MCLLVTVGKYNCHHTTRPSHGIPRQFVRHCAAYRPYLRAPCEPEPNLEEIPWLCPNCHWEYTQKHLAPLWQHTTVAKCQILNEVVMWHPPDETYFESQKAADLLASSFVAQQKAMADTAIAFHELRDTTLRCFLENMYWPCMEWAHESNRSWNASENRDPFERVISDADVMNRTHGLEASAWAALDSHMNEEAELQARENDIHSADLRYAYYNSSNHDYPDLDDDDDDDDDDTSSDHGSRAIFISHTSDNRTAAMTNSPTNSPGRFGVSESASEGPRCMFCDNYARSDRVSARRRICDICKSEINQNVREFFGAVLGAPFIEGYEQRSDLRSDTDDPLVNMPVTPGNVGNPMQQTLCVNLPFDRSAGPSQRSRRLNPSREGLDYAFNLIVEWNDLVNQNSFSSLSRWVQDFETTNNRNEREPSESPRGIYPFATANFDLTDRLPVYNFEAVLPDQMPPRSSAELDAIPEGEALPSYQARQPESPIEEGEIDEDAMELTR